MTQHAIATAPGQLWFDQACDAFKQSFPDVAAARIPAERFYVCPICLVVFNEQALALRVLTREHVPPKSLGGKRLALTCKKCNDRGGHDADNHARREADMIGFVTGDLKERKARLRTPSGRVPILVSVGGGTVTMKGVKKASSEAERDAVKGDFQGAVGEGNWRDFTFNVDFAAYSPGRAAASWLRSAYLAFFSALGYRFIYRRELDVVRARIQNPELKEPVHFRIAMPEKVEPTLIRIDEPEAFRSYAMLFDRHAVFLPRYNDRGLYARLAEQPAGTVTFSGKQYPWPQHGPTFLHDQHQQ